MIVKKNLITFNVKPCNIVKPNDTWYGGSEDFWKKVSLNLWEPETFDIFDKYISKNYSYIDIGSWVGPTVLYGAQLCSKCYSFEADDIAFSILKDNVLENPKISNIELYNKAIANYTGKINFGTNTNKGDSMSSILWTKESQQVNCISLEDFFIEKNIEDCNFIKVDIEGGEFSIVPTFKNILQSFKPTIYLSLHIPWISDSKYNLQKLFDSLSFYKKIYSLNGNLLSNKDFVNLSGFTSVIFTNIG